MEIEGTLVQILPLESGVSRSGNPWSKATVIIETLGQYPKKVALTNMKNAEEYSKLPIGSQIKFKIDVESREFNGRWYSDIRAYAYELQGSQASQHVYTQSYPQSQYQQPIPQSPQVAPTFTSQGDDIPF